jgi:hypothetical protein
MQVRATNIEGKKRCVFADSWFASVETALAVRTELGCDFTGPIKTAHKYFPLEHIRWTLSEMKRGEHVVFKCNEDENYIDMMDQYLLIQENNDVISHLIKCFECDKIEFK